MFGSILAYSAYMHLIRAWRSARAGTYAYWNPLAGVLLGGWLGGETIRARTLPGLALILLRVGLVQIPWPAFSAEKAMDARRAASLLPEEES